jgi:hypothetical protein
MGGARRLADDAQRGGDLPAQAIDGGFEPAGNPGEAGDGGGRLSRKPWASPQVSPRRKSSSSSRSMPSATTGSLRPAPRPSTARTMAADCSLLSTDLMKDWSILILSNGKARRLASEE